MTWSFREFMAWMRSEDAYRGRVMPRPVPRPASDHQPILDYDASRPKPAPPGRRGNYTPVAGVAPTSPPPAPPKGGSGGSRMKQTREEFISETVKLMVLSGAYSDWHGDKMVLHAEALWSGIAKTDS